MNTEKPQHRLCRRNRPFFFTSLLLSFTELPVWAHVEADGQSTPGWHWRPDVLFVVFLFGFAYTRGWLRLRRLSSTASRARHLTLYLLGLGLVSAALVSPVDRLASTLLSMHMLQHLLLMMLAPLCFLFANPLPALLWGLPGKWRYFFGRQLVPGSKLRGLLYLLTSMPVSWSLYVIDLWVWHHPALYQLALRNRQVHDLQHLLFFLTSLFFWWPIVNPAPRLHPLPHYGYRIVYLIGATLQNTLLGMAISLPDRLLYPFYATAARFPDSSPLNDQALGGGLMWLGGHMYLIPILILVAQMLKAEEKRSRPALMERPQK